jgi:hypothetical protein
VPHEEMLTRKIRFSLPTKNVLLLARVPQH